MPMNIRKRLKDVDLRGPAALDVQFEFQKTAQPRTTALKELASI